MCIVEGVGVLGFRVSYSFGFMVLYSSGFLRPKRKGKGTALNLEPQASSVLQLPDSLELNLVRPAMAESERGLEFRVRGSRFRGRG